MLNRGGTYLLERSHDDGGVLVWIADAHPHGGDTGPAWRRLECGFGAVSIGPDESTHAELGTAEIAYDDDHHVSELSTVDGGQDRSPRTAAGLARVVGAPDAVTQSPGGAVMSCVEVGALQGAEQLPGGLLGVGRCGDSEEARAADPELCVSSIRQRQEGPVSRCPPPWA